MDLKKLWTTALLAAFLVVGVPITASAQFQPGGVIGPSTFTFTAGSQSNVWSCNGGQSSFQLSVPSGFVGVLTVTVSQASGGTYSEPPWAYTPGVPSYTNTLTNSGALTVNLGSNLYVKVADTTYTSGSVTVTGVCSQAVAVIPPQVLSVTAAGPLASSGGVTPNLTCASCITTSLYRAGTVAGVNTGGVSETSVSFSSALASAPIVIVTINNLTGSGTTTLSAQVDNVTTTGFKVYVSGGSSTGTVSVNYYAIGAQ